MVKKFPELRTSDFYDSVDQTIEKAAATILAIPQAYSVKDEPVDEPIDLTETPPPPITPRRRVTIKEEASTRKTPGSEAR